MATSPQTRGYKDRLLARGDIEALIAEGRKIVIVNGRVLKTDAWLPYHPGGDKAILHMVGRDATNEVTAFHSAETLEFMHKYQIGRVEGIWADFVPPLQCGKFRTREEQEQDACESSGHSQRESSAEPSPVFEPAEKAGLRRRGSGAGCSESSATSLSDMELDGAPKCEYPNQFPTLFHCRHASNIRHLNEQDLSAFSSVFHMADRPQ
jgi:sphingolipid 8-(E)-desaturase